MREEVHSNVLKAKHLPSLDALSRMQPWSPSGGVELDGIDTAGGDRRQIGIASPHGCFCPARLCQDGSAQCPSSLETQVTLVDGEPMVPGEERLAGCWDRVLALEVEEISDISWEEEISSCLALGGRGQEPAQKEAPCGIGMLERHSR